MQSLTAQLPVHPTNASDIWFWGLAARLALFDSESVVSDIKLFFDEMTRHLPDGSRVLYSQFRGDPATNANWAAKVLNNPEFMDEGANVYLCVSAMKKNADGKWYRRKDNFAAGLLLMIDDLGDGPASKFPLSTIDVLQPTALIETSPGNHQAIYMFNEAITDQKQFNALIDAFVAAQFLGKDTGMKGVTRVFRPPHGVNAKAAHMRDGKAFRVRLVEWHPDNRYSYNAICRAFDLNPIVTATIKHNVYTEDVIDRTDRFLRYYKAAERCGLVKGDSANHTWIHVSCPWRDAHTGGLDNGAGITPPNEENQWYGAFKCHHGSCDKRNFKDLADHLLDIMIDELNDANNAGGYMPFSALRHGKQGDTT